MVSQGRTFSLIASDFMKGGCRGPDSGGTESRAGSQESIKINSFPIHYLQFETSDLFDSLACGLIRSNYVQTAGGQQRMLCH